MTQCYFWADNQLRFKCALRQCTRTQSMVQLRIADTKHRPTLFVSVDESEALRGRMSETKGNIIDPLYTIDKCGISVLRLSLMTGCTSLLMGKIEINHSFADKGLGLWLEGPVDPTPLPAPGASVD